jgi:hypothetical protein
MNVRCGAALAFATVVLSPVPARVCAQSAVPPHIAAAHVFLTAWGHERWDELQGVAADAVTVRFADRVFSLEPASRKSEIRVVFPFRGLSTVRAGAEVKGVAVDELGGQVGGKETRGPATLTLREEGGRFRIIGVSFGTAR